MNKNMSAKGGAAFGGKTLLLIHGPNLNFLGKREEKHYGALTLKQLENLVGREAGKYGFRTKVFQSNHEGVLIDFLQKHAVSSSGIIINPGALAHYSYSLYDALVDANIPAVEVHLSKIKSREVWRRKSVTAPACVSVISGKKEKGYVEAVKKLSKPINP